MTLPREVATTSPWRVWIGQRRNLVALCLSVLGIAAMFVVAIPNRGSWSVDFNQYYAAAKLAGTGHLYDWTAIQALELEHNSKAVPYGRLPVYALILKPLSLLPYPLARAFFLLIEIAAIAGFVVLWPFSHRIWACMAVCWSVSAAMCLAFGQDSVLFLFFMALGYWLLRSGRDFWAGVAFAVCASKPHIAALLPLVLAAQARWNVLLGGIAGGVVIVVVSFATEGPAWPMRLLELTRLPDFDPAGNRMPNLRGLLSVVGASFSVEILLTLVAAVAIFLLSRRISLKCAMTVALAGGLMLSHHSYVYDCVLLIPALLLPFEEAYPDWVRMWALILFTPIPYMLMLTDMDLPGHLAVTGYTVALMLTMEYRLRGGNSSLCVATATTGAIPKS